MPDPNVPRVQQVTEDRGLKAFLTEYPHETLEFFVPELMIERGRPVSIVPVQQELPLPDLGDPSRFLDLALLATWADGTQQVILLVEHWSEARKVERVRVLWYYAGLRLRHPDAEVFPVVFVTDRSSAAIPNRLHSIVADLPVLDFRYRVVHITEADLPRLRGLQNRVAALFQALAIKDAIEAAVTAVTAMAHTPGPVDDLRRYLALAQKLANLHESQEPQFRQRLREEPTMGNVFEDLMTESEAKGEAKAAQATIATIRRLVARGIMPVDVARAEIEELIATKGIPEILGREALGLLG